jgi:hypothetical protein
MDTVTVVFGFIVIVAGVMLLQLSKGSADPAEVEIPDINSSIVEDKIEISTGEEPGTLAGVPMAVARQRTRRKSLKDYERSHSLMADFEAGPMAMRSNLFQTFRRSKLIVEELVHEKRERDFELKAATNMAARRHTVHIGGGESAVPHEQQAEEGQMPQARVKYGRSAEGGQDDTMWHKVKTMHHGNQGDISPIEEGDLEIRPDKPLEPSSSVSTGIDTPVDDKRQLLPTGRRRSLSENVFSVPSSKR